MEDAIASYERNMEDNVSYWKSRFDPTNHVYELMVKYRREHYSKDERYQNGDDGLEIHPEMLFPAAEKQRPFQPRIESASQAEQREDLRSRRWENVCGKSPNAIHKPKNIAASSGLRGYKRRRNDEDVDEDVKEDYSKARKPKQPYLLFNPPAPCDSTRSPKLPQMVAT